MTAAILVTAAGLFGLQACRDVESEKIDQVNDLIHQLSGSVALVNCQFGAGGSAPNWKTGILSATGRIRRSEPVMASGPLACPGGCTRQAGKPVCHDSLESCLPPAPPLPPNPRGFAHEIRISNYFRGILRG